jgi:hypothetical protein
MAFVDRSANLEQAVLEVNVAPAQRQGFADP